jgi:phosphosulfolactate synthase
MNDMLEDFGQFIDVVKFGIGTAYTTPRLVEKIKGYRNAGLIVYFGGTLFEKFYAQDKLDAYADFLKQHDVNHIEISSGTLDIAIEEQVELVHRFKGDFTCFCEVGTKDTSTVMPPSVWIDQMGQLLEAGAAYVIAEGRDSGTAGIFRPSGELRMGLVSDLADKIGMEHVIFEAPTHASQMVMINQFGPNVNLGNIKPSDVLILETQRQGLRYETFFTT